MMKTNFYLRRATAAFVKYVIAIFVCVNTSFAQVPSWQWSHDGGGDNWDFGNDIATDPFGNVYVTGYFSSSSATFGSFTLDNTGSAPYEDMFLVKYDPSGNVVWANKAGGTISEEGNAVTTDAAGNIYVSGFFRSSSVTFGSFTLFLSGDYNIFLVKYDPNGNVLWAKSAPTSISIPYALNTTFGITTDVTGNVLITGLFQGSSITFGTTTLNNTNNNGGGDLFIAKYDGAGNSLWAISATGDNEDVGESIATDAGGNIYVSGYFYSPTMTLGGITVTNDNGISHTDAYVLKCDASGNVSWLNAAGSIEDDMARRVTTDLNGDVFITGEFNSASITFGNITLNNTSPQKPDIFIAKYDDSGNILWAVKAGGQNFDYSYGIVTDTAGNVYITGNFDYSIFFGNITLSSNNFSDDVYIAKYDGNGNVIYAVNGSGNGPDYSYSIALDHDGNAFITGGFASDFIVFDNTTVVNSNYSSNPYLYDMFVAKYGFPACSNVYYQDADGDLFGNAGISFTGCQPPKGYVTDSADCDDSNSAIFPGAFDIPNNGIDEDCDGSDAIATAITGSITSPYISLFPNPSNGKFNLNMQMDKNLSGTATIEIVNTIGQILYLQQNQVSDGVLHSEIIFDHAVMQGMYLLRLIFNDQVYSTEVIYQQ